MRWMSACSVSRMRGRWTLTATCSPLCAIARWTWPIDAAANDSCATEDRLRLPAELAADDLADLGVGERRDLVEELEQLVAVRGRQQVEAQGQHLAQLDPGRRRAVRRRGGPDRATPSVGARQAEGGRDEEADEDREDVPDPARMLEQRPHVARPGHASRAVRSSGGVAQAGRPSVEPDRSRVLVIQGTRRRRFGSVVSSSHSRPARTMSRRSGGTSAGGRSSPLGSELRLAAVADPQPDTLSEPGLAFIERLGHAALAQPAGVGLTFLGRRAFSQALPAFAFAGDLASISACVASIAGCCIRRGIARTP